jgi:hypothetical protein
VLYAFSEEIPTDNNVTGSETESFKILWTNKITTRSMCRDEEQVEILMDIDLATNHKDFCAMFKDPAMARRIYPIERIQYMNEKFWTKFQDKISETNFIRSWVKFIREEFPSFYDCHDYKPAAPFQQSKLYYEIKDMVSQDSVALWFDSVKESGELLRSIDAYEDKDGNVGFSTEDLFKNYLKKCSELKSKNFGLLLFRTEKIKELGFELAERRVTLFGREGPKQKKKLAFISKEKITPELEESLDL